MNIDSPRKRFFDGDFSKDHRRFVTSDHCIAALDATLLQLQADLGSPENTTNAMINGFRLDGARRFAHLFATLAEKPESKSNPLTDGLPFPNA